MLRVSERIPPLRGGKEIHIAELTRAQVDSGNDVEVLYRSGDDIHIAAPATRVAVPRPLRHVRGLAGTALFAAAAARSASALVPPDLVHVHGDLAEVFFMARYARTVNAAVVLTAHGGLNPRYRRPSRFAFSFVDAAIAHGDHVRGDLLRCGVPADRIAVMSSGLSMDLIALARDQSEREPGLVVTVGSLDPVKNIDMVIKAVLLTPASSGVHVDVIGEGPLLKSLEAAAGGSHRVRFLGQLSRPEVYRRVAAADAFVIASRRLAGKSEGIPTALLEAMALGRLCLVSNAVTPRPVIADNRTYLPFDPEDHESLCRLVLAAVTDRSCREAIGRRAMAAVANLGWVRTAARVQGIYERALDDRRRRS